MADTQQTQRHEGSSTHERLFHQRNIHVQFIDDKAGGRSRPFQRQARLCPTRQACGQRAGAQVIGKLAADAALAKGIKSVVFDRGGARYHRSESKGKDGKRVSVLGKLATLAEAARAAGLKF